MNVTKLLIGINVLVFFVLELIGQTENASFMKEIGAVFPPYIIEGGEYWRLFTATFMHFGFQHLLNNMVMLGAAGTILEKADSVKMGIHFFRFCFFFVAQRLRR